MIPRRIIAPASGRKRTALSVVALLGAAAGLQVSAASAESAPDAPLTADRLSEALLAGCEAGAAPYGRYDAAIAESVAALIAIGAFAPSEFSGARIGFCPLRREGGPVGVASCAEDVILVDEKYRKEKEALVLSATLAHEMTHVLQHRARREAQGAAWCDSADFRAEKPALEAAADEFGDAAAALLVLGRPVEIVNSCDAPMTIYLEADDPVAVRGASPAFMRLAPRGSALAAERALSPRAGYFAEPAPAPAAPTAVEERASSRARIVEGRLIRLKAARLAAADRLQSPFRLRLSCAGEASDMEAS